MQAKATAETEYNMKAAALISNMLLKTAVVSSVCEWEHVVEGHINCLQTTPTHFSKDLNFARD